MEKPLHKKIHSIANMLDDDNTTASVFLRGANMGIDLTSKNLPWKQDECPWNAAEKTSKHKCAVKNVSICKYFNGVAKPDTVICSYPR